MPPSTRHRCSRTNWCATVASQLERGEVSLTEAADALGVWRIDLRRALVRSLGEARTDELVEIGREGLYERRKAAKRGAESRADPLAGVADRRPAMVPLRGRTVLIVQVLDGSLVRLASGHRVERAATEAIQLGGSVIVPADRLEAVLLAVRRLTKK